MSASSWVGSPSVLERVYVSKPVYECEREGARGQARFAKALTGLLRKERLSIAVSATGRLYLHESVIVRNGILARRRL